MSVDLAFEAQWCAAYSFGAPPAVSVSGNIEQEMPPWGPRYEPIWPTCAGMGATDVIDFSDYHMLELAGCLTSEDDYDGLLLRSLS